ncbi:MAG: glycosyltransferase [Flavisolibacter sp.]
MNAVPSKADLMSVSEKVPDLKGRDIVMVGLQPWYFPTGCNAKNIATMLSKNNRVLYVNFPLKRKLYHSRNPDSKIVDHIRIIKDKEKNIKPVKENLWEFYPTTLIESVNWLPATSIFKLINSINNQRLAKELNAVTKEMGFSNVILLNDNDIYNGFYLKEYMKPDLYIYYMRDFLQAYDYWKKHTSVLEPELMKKSDIVITNSEYYTEYSAAYNKHAYYMGQGCSLDHFDPYRLYQVPPDVAELKRPLIGYIGALDAARLDEEILSVIARANPDWNVVLVGPADDVFAKSRLHSIPNIHFLGGKPFDTLSSYVNAFDVCINPQFNNQITKGNYPLKIDEYLAMGKPVVATKTQAMNLFSSHTYLAESPDQYPDLIRQALVEDSKELQAERVRFARSHTWEECMVELYRAIHHYQDARQS